jgi:predicted nucleotidyltransferase
MRPSEALQLHRQEIRFIVEQHHAKNVRVFGSVLDGEDTELSDLDLLVDTTDQTTFFDIAKIQNQLQKLLHVSVDVLTPKGIPERFRAKILREAHLV